MHDVSKSQHYPYFTDAEWQALTLVIRTSFLALLQDGANTAALHPLAAVVRMVVPLMPDAEIHLFMGDNGNPQLKWKTVDGKLSEVQVMSDRIIWYTEGKADGIEYLNV